MSYKLMTQIWKTDLPTTEKFVLLALADYADDNGECWPGQSALADRCSLTQRSVIRAVKSLQEKGFVEVLKQGKNKNRYKVSVVTQSHNTAPASSDRESPQSSDTESLQEPLVVTQSHHSSDTESHLVVTESHHSSDTESHPLQMNLPKNLSVEPVSEPSRAHTHARPAGAEDYVTMIYPENITDLAIRFAEIRRDYSDAKKVSHEAIDYYSGLITSILVADEYGEQDLELLIDWFSKCEDGQRAWSFGMSDLINAHIHKNTRSSPDFKQHVLIRNIAGYLGRARDWKSGKSKKPYVPPSVKAYHDRVQKHDPATASRRLSLEEIEAAKREELPW